MGADGNSIAIANATAIGERGLDAQGTEESQRAQWLEDCEWG